MSDGNCLVASWMRSHSHSDHPQSGVNAELRNNIKGLFLICPRVMNLSRLGKWVVALAVVEEGKERKGKEKTRAEWICG